MVHLIEEATWHDLSLGCGPIEGNNPAMEIDGWVYVLDHHGDRYTFHLAIVESTGDELVRNCTDVASQTQPTVNLVHDLRLHEARRVILARGAPGSEAQVVADIQDGEQIRRLLDALDTEISINNPDVCATALRLDFHLAEGVETVRMVCVMDWYRIGGKQEIWGGMQGSIPQAVLDFISPALAAQPLPGFPTLPDE